MLFESVTQPFPTCLELLLKHGAPIDFPDDAVDAVMMAAMAAQDNDLADWLLLRGASVHVAAKGGMTPAYSVQFPLQKFKPRSPTYNKLLHLRALNGRTGSGFPGTESCRGTGKARQAR
jgi:ankyrin repeat protein